MAELDRPLEEVYVKDSSAENVRFDDTMGAIEEILMSEDFGTLQENFCKEHAAQFDDNSENKHEYHAIFQNYARLMEEYIEKSLADRIQNFSMKEFAAALQANDVGGDVFDLLLGFTDFIEFKDMMLAYKAGQPLDLLISTTSHK